jgi:hypothetical protein
MSYNKIKVIGALYNLRKSIKPTSFFYHLEMCTCTVFLYFFPVSLRVCVPVLQLRHIWP